MPQIRLNPRTPRHRINTISFESCLAILDWVIPELAAEPKPAMEGAGVVTVAGGRYLRYAFASITKLRELDPDIPVQIWHLPGEDLTGRELFDDLNVTWHDVGPAFEHEGAWVRSGWSAKAHAILHSGLRNVMFLDADCFPMLPPSEMFDSPEFRKFGLILFQDCAEHRNSGIWASMGLRANSFPDHEAGQFLIDCEKHLATLRLYCWMSGFEFFMKEANHGDKHLPGLCCC